MDLDKGTCVKDGQVRNRGFLGGGSVGGRGTGKTCVKGKGTGQAHIWILWWNR